jgi:hypothetical protein
VTRARGRRIGTVAAAVLTAAATLAGGVAAAPVSYTCTGIASTDQASLQTLIAGGGTIVLHGPHVCVGNFVASSVTVTIVGSGSGATMDGRGTGSVLIAVDSTVTLENLTLTNGLGSGADDDPSGVGGANGGALSTVDSTLTVDRCVITANRAADQGGGIHAAESTLVLTDSTVSNNVSAEGGGGIDADDDVDLTLTRSTVSGNATGPHGGGVELFDGSLTVTDSTITRNKVTDSTDFRSGGGIWSGLSVVTLTRSTVNGNTSTEFGGGIGFSGGPGSSLSLVDSTVSGNRADLGGGGIRNDAYYGDAPLLIDRSNVTGNRARYGGGIDVFGLHGFTSSLTLTSSLVADNRALHGLGGGIDSYIDPSGGSTSISVAATTIGARPNRLNDGNQADFGGGIAADGANGPATIDLHAGTALVANVAAYGGGGVFTRNGAALAIGPGVLMLLNRPDNVDRS